jgi:hypothetical protein
VDLISRVSSEFLLSQQTKHLAIAYVDAFLSAPSHQPSEPVNLATVSLFVASKMMEAGVKVPTLLSLMQATRCKLLRVLFVDQETQLLSTLNFNLHLRTPLSVFSLLHEVSLGDRSPSKAKIVRRYTPKMRQKTASSILVGRELIDFASQDYRFTQFTPEILAGSAIVLSRKAIGLVGWPRTLENLTGIPIKLLSKCARKLWKAFQGSQRVSIEVKHASHPSFLLLGEYEATPKITGGEIEQIFTKNSVAAPKICRRRQIQKTGRSKVKLGTFHRPQTGSPSNDQPIDEGIFAFNRPEEYQQSGLPNLLICTL